MLEKEKVKLEWDGDKIMQKIHIPNTRLTPKEILDSLDMVRNQISQMEAQKLQAETQIKRIGTDIESARSFEKNRAEFEEKCISIQLERLKEVISKISDSCKGIADKDSRETIEKDPSAYNDNQKANMNYVNYQRLLATDKVIATEISKRLIKDYLFDKPIFDNPFLSKE